MAVRGQLDQVFLKSYPTRRCSNRGEASVAESAVKIQIATCLAAGGNLTRQPDQDRIDFLAQVRNAALEPLWLKVGAGDGGQGVAQGGAGLWYNQRARGLKSQALWPADKVVFLNDVYFCARDAVRLLLHDADMACGMDFDRKSLDQIPAQVESIAPPPPHTHHHLGSLITAA